jgi:hypothetical protein
MLECLSSILISSVQGDIRRIGRLREASCGRKGEPHRRHSEEGHKSPCPCGAAAVTIVAIHIIFLPTYPSIIPQTARFALIVLPLRSPDKAKPVRLEGDRMKRSLILWRPGGVVSKDEGTREWRGSAFARVLRDGGCATSSA